MPKIAVQSCCRWRVAGVTGAAIAPVPVTFPPSVGNVHASCFVFRRDRYVQLDKAPEPRSEVEGSTGRRAIAWMIETFAVERERLEMKE